MLCVPFFKQPERLVFVSETRINQCNLIEIDIGVRRQVPEFLGDLQRISPPARDSVNPTKSASNELILCRYNFVLIGNLVVFGKGLWIHALHCVRASQRGTNYCSAWIQVESLLELSNGLIVSSSA